MEYSPGWHIPRPLDGIFPDPWMEYSPNTLPCDVAAGCDMGAGMGDEKDVPFHNAIHVLDVLQTMHAFLVQCDIINWATSFEVPTPSETLSAPS
eukprot:7565616-Pyramimonas_sp.AAC.1